MKPELKPCPFCGGHAVYENELYDFDYAVMKAVNFAHRHPDTTVIMLADHETGGLTDKCQYTSHGHTGVNIPLHAYGKHAHLFNGVQDNTDINAKIRKILFNPHKPQPKKHITKPTRKAP